MFFFFRAESGLRCGMEEVVGVEGKVGGEKGVLVDGGWREGVRDLRARFLRLGGEEKLGTQ